MSIVFGIFVGIVISLIVFAFYKECVVRRIDYLEDKIDELKNELDTKDIIWNCEKEKVEDLIYGEDEYYPYLKKESIFDRIKELEKNKRDMEYRINLCESRINSMTGFEHILYNKIKSSLELLPEMEEHEQSAD